MSERWKNTKGKNKIIELKFGVEEPMDLEMDALLQEELMREADELEAKLNSDPDLIGMGASEDLFAKIVGELKEKGIWEEEPERAEGLDFRVEEFEKAEGQDFRVEEFEKAKKQDLLENGSGEREEVRIGEEYLEDDHEIEQILRRIEEKEGREFSQETENREPESILEHEMKNVKGANIGAQKKDIDYSEGIEQEDANSKESIENDSEENDVKENNSVEADLEKLYAMLPEEDRRALKIGRWMEREQAELKQKKMVRRKRMKRIMRRGATAAAVMMLVFGVSMTSDANRRLVSKMWDSVAANFGLKIATEYVEEDRVICEGGNEQEKIDFQMASEELGISGIDLGYLPDGMEYMRCEIDKESGKATFFYSYEESIFQIAMVKKEEEGVFYYALDNKIKLESEYTDIQKIEAKIGDANTESEEETYMAQLKYEECNYILNGMISLEEMKKIIKNIYFL